MVKKIIQIFINFLSISMIVISIIALISVVFSPKDEIPSVFGYSILHVLTGSMEPTITSNDIIVVKKVLPNKIETNDIISFYSREEDIYGEINTHRVIDVEKTESAYFFITKGDANELVDNEKVNGEDLLGKVIWNSSLLGKIIKLLINPIFFILFIALPLFSMIIYNIIKVIKSAKEVAKEEELQAIKEAKKQLKQDIELLQKEAKLAKKDKE